MRKPWYERLAAWSKTPPKPPTPRNGKPYWFDKVPTPVTAFSGVQLKDDKLSYKGQYQPVAGANVLVDSAGEIQRRATLTRTAAGGLLFGGTGAVVGALFQKQVDKRELYLLVEGERFTWAVPVNPKRGATARAFAATINTAARK